MDAPEAVRRAQRRANVTRSPRNGLEARLLHATLESEFRSSYRMTRADFEAFHGVCRPYLPESSARMSSLSSGMGDAHITTELKLLALLRYLVAGDTSSVVHSFHVERTTAYRMRNEALQAVIAALPITFPETSEERVKTSFRFARFSNYALQHCLGAVDGFTLRVLRIGSDETDTLAAYWNRKGFYSINIQAVADSDFRFTNVSASAAGATHDSKAFKMGHLGKALYEGGPARLGWGAWSERVAAPRHDPACCRSQLRAFLLQPPSSTSSPTRPTPVRKG